MTVTYGGDPSNSNLDAVRLLVGDTDIANAYLQDEEIAYFLAEKGNVFFSAALAAGAIAARLSRRYDVSGAISKSQGTLQEKFFKLAAELRRRGSESCTFTAGGVYRAEKLADELNEALVQPDFSIGMDDNPQTSSGNDPRGSGFA